MRTIWVLTVAIGLAACSSGAGGGVPWGDYAPGVRARIDALARASDCGGLQGEFDTANAGSAATKSRTGHNNAELMRYINDLMKDKGC